MVTCSLWAGTSAANLKRPVECWASSFDLFGSTAPRVSMNNSTVPGSDTMAAIIPEVVHTCASHWIARFILIARPVPIQIGTGPAFAVDAPDDAQPVSPVAVWRKL